MSSDAFKTASDDPLRSVADALDAAVEAAKHGAGDAAAAAANAAPAFGNMLSGLTYKTCYALSYGVVFPAALVARVVPKDNAIIHGFIDGARAARDFVDEMQAKAAAESHTEPPIA